MFSFSTKIFLRSLKGSLIITGSIYYTFYLYKRLSYVKIKSAILAPVTLSLSELFNSKEVKGAGLDLLESYFKDKEMIDLILNNLLKPSVKHPSFIEESKKFSKSWLLTVVKSPEFKEEAKQISKAIAKTEESKSVSAELLKESFLAQSTKDTSKLLFTNVCLADTVFVPMMDLFNKSANIAITSEDTKNAFNILGTNISNNNHLWSFIIKKTVGMNPAFDYIKNETNEN